MKFKYHRQTLLLFLVLIPFVGLAHDVTSADQEILRTGGLWAYIRVGATHMLTGYDHLLFLAGVIFYLNSFKDILKFITVFTIGHCITLIGATYTGITADEHLVDAVIAVSVLYKGFENLGGFEKLNIKPPNLLVMVGLFGLIHGFGLSTRLQSFDMGEGQFLAKILCFNLGVEVGQVLALIPITFIITLARKQEQFPAFYKAVNWYLVLAGIALFVYQLYGYFTGH
ncbi:MAG: HupE/UreJ family protein [Bacteroidota bacterium]